MSTQAIVYQRPNDINHGSEGYSTEVQYTGMKAYGSMHDYETNRKKSVFIAVLGLLWSGIWLFFLIADLGYINTNFVAPAGTAPTSTGVPGCLWYTD